MKRIFISELSKIVIVYRPKKSDYKVSFYLPDDTYIGCKYFSKCQGEEYIDSLFSFYEEL